jgi:hypothetical protein
LFLSLAPPDGVLLALFGAAAQLTRLLVVFVLAQFFRQAAAFQQLLEAAQGRTDRFSFVDAHP